MQFDRSRRQRGQAAGRSRAGQVPYCIPVLPLPNVVLFPRTYLPLHIFEPRYREMVADAAAGGGCLGITLLKEGWEEDYYGTPAMFPIGCVGRLVTVHKLPGGRSDILLQGLERYEIRQEVGGKSYRQAEIHLKALDKASTLDHALRGELIRALKEYVATHDDGYRWQSTFPLDANDEVLVNSLSTYLDFTPLEKQFLLEAESLCQQAHRLHDLIQFKQLERAGSRGWG